MFPYLCSNKENKIMELENKQEKPEVNDEEYKMPLKYYIPFFLTIWLGTGAVATGIFYKLNPELLLDPNSGNNITWNIIGGFATAILFLFFGIVSIFEHLTYFIIGH